MSEPNDLVSPYRQRKQRERDLLENITEVSPEERQRKFDETREIFGKYSRWLREKKSNIFDDNRMKEFYDKLLGQYTETFIRENCMMWHILIFSSIGKDDFPLFDLPGEYSIYDWVKSLEQIMQPK